MAKRHPNEFRIWETYTPEEKSITILNAYKHRYLLPEDIKKFLWLDRLQVWSYWGFPAISYAALFYSGALDSVVAYRLPYRAKYYAPAIVTGALWLAWVNISPFQAKLDHEKMNLLELLEERVNVKMKFFNDMVPRSYTTQEIHRQLRKLYNDRHGPFTNILYASDEYATPLVDNATYPFKYRRGKIVR